MVKRKRVEVRLPNPRSGLLVGVGNISVVDPTMLSFGGDLGGPQRLDSIAGGAGNLVGDRLQLPPIDRVVDEADPGPIVEMSAISVTR
ncbi:hypothetical protein GJ633_07145 [Halorubrum sp. CBA1125]|uniref:hypothetical protein n=1 Tax=Halorubrum sp. CBA1125 TaxID=2668072 RepID=UPI0012E83CBC|nr:hypothetical protein [Halorubrum sp. CBA1125]MUW14470.1 hypothetical protein [Halorubrum sp. CBA1125]